MKNLMHYFGILTIIALFTSCTSTLLTSSWAMEGYTPQTYKRILVFAIASQTSTRGMVETAMVNSFREKGFNATSSLSMFPNSPNVPDPNNMLTKEQLAQLLSDNHIDGFLILSVLDVREEEVYVEGNTYTQPVYTQPVPVYHPNGYYDRYDPYYGDYYTYYNTVYETVSEPGYYENRTTFYLESNFYNVNTTYLVWSGQSESVDPADIGQGSKEWANAVVNGMKNEKIILPEPKSK